MRKVTPTSNSNKWLKREKSVTKISIGAMIKKFMKKLKKTTGTKLKIKLENLLK